MGEHSAIEWTDASWTPIRARRIEIQNDGSGKERVGWHCEPVSPECEFCYAERINLRLGTGLPFKPDQLFREEKVGYHNGESKIFLDDKLLTAPLRWGRPRMIFVCSMTDLFADFVKDEWIDRMFAIMALCPHHIFQVLTKRPVRMRSYCNDPSARDRISVAMWSLSERRTDHISGGWPLRNVWFGTSVGDQRRAQERIPHLLKTPAAVRFISAEPLLGPVDLTYNRFCGIMGWGPQSPPMIGDDAALRIKRQTSWLLGAPGLHSHHINWVIAGGESGPWARPTHPDWVRSLRDQCTAAGIPFFFKQWGTWAPHQIVPGGDLGADVRAGRVQIVHPSGRSQVEIGEATGGRSTEPGSRYMERIGKKAAGAVLDGREHRDFPRVLT